MSIVALTYRQAGHIRSTHSPGRQHYYFWRIGAFLDNCIRQIDRKLGQQHFQSPEIELHKQPVFSRYEMAHFATSVGLSVLLLALLALASPSESYSSTCTRPSIPTLTAAILRSPFVNRPIFTALDVQAPYNTESTSRLILSINTTTLETRTSTHVPDPTMKRFEIQVTPISTECTCSSAPLEASSIGTTPGCAAICRKACHEANKNDEVDENVIYVDALEGRALRPIPVSDSGSVPLEAWSGWTWCAGLGIFSMGILVML